MNYYRDKRNNEIKKLYNSPANKRLRFWALASISVSIVLVLAMIIWIDKLEYKLLMFMRGCTGLFAIFFVILSAILVYRVNKEHIDKR